MLKLNLEDYTESLYYSEKSKNLNDVEDLGKGLVELQEIESGLYSWLNKKQQEVNRILRDESFERLQIKIRDSQEKIKQLIKKKL